MPGKIEALGILLLLLPGLTCAYIAQHLAVRREQTELDKVVEALIFSFLLYLATLPFFGYTLPVSWRVATDGSYQITPHYAHLLTLLISSVVIGVLYAANINRDWLLTLLRWCGLTERTARSSIWNDIFQEIGGFVQVGFKDGKRLIGWVRYYSDDASDSSVFLEDAAWVMEDDQQQPIDGPGILLTKESAIETVSFLNWATNDSISETNTNT
jgi:hypothetical protein